MPEKIKDVADRLGTTVAELERRIDEQRAVIRGKVAALDLPPGYESGSHELRLPDPDAWGMFRDMAETRALWVKPGKGRPAVESPLESAQFEHESAILKRIGKNRRTPAAVKASGKAAEARIAKAQATHEAVAILTAQGKLPHTIARAVGITARRVKQIQAAAKQTEITAAEK